MSESGYECHACGGKTRVTNTRSSTTGIRRRRQCLDCGTRRTTYEILWPEPLSGVGRGLSSRVLLLERLVSLPESAIRIVDQIVTLLEESEGRAARAERSASAWKELARALRDAARRPAA